LTFYGRVPVSQLTPYKVKFVQRGFTKRTAFVKGGWDFTVSSSLARQPYVGPGLSQKILPAKVIQLLLLQISWQECFPGWGCQPHAQPPAIPEGHFCFTVNDNSL
jgi:hypothetical protein